MHASSARDMEINTTPCPHLPPGKLEHHHLSDRAAVPELNPN
jgi:hypothetical protein